MRETTLKAKAIYERLAELECIACKVDSNELKSIHKARVNWGNIYISEEYQDLMNDADEVHSELEKQWNL